MRNWFFLWISNYLNGLTEGIFETGAYGVPSKSQNPTVLGYGGPSSTQCSNPSWACHFATVLKTKNGWVLWFTWYSVCTIFKNSSFKTALWNLVANLVKIRMLLQTWFQPSVAKLPIVKLKKKDALKLLKSVFSWMSDEINSLCLSSIYSMYKQLWIFWHSHAFWRHTGISSKKSLEIGYCTDITYISTYFQS